MMIEEIEEKLKHKFPNAYFGENSGLPFVAVPVEDFSTTLHVVEKVLNTLDSLGVQLPILLDLKNNFVEIRYAITAEQREIITIATN